MSFVDVFRLFFFFSTLQREYNIKGPYRNASIFRRDKSIEIRLTVCHSRQKNDERYRRNVRPHTKNDLRYEPLKDF